MDSEKGPEPSRCDTEVHTHEEAQVFVHDLNQFVTVQLFEETPVVLSQSKFCKDHGYSNEWVSGQEPPKMGKSLICTTDNFLLFPKTVRLLLRHHQNRRDQRHLLHHRCSKLIFRFSIRAK